MNKLLILFYLFVSFIIDANDNTIIIKKVITFPNQTKKITKDQPFRSTNDYSRPCQKSDIIGFWTVVKWTPFFHIPAKDWNKPSFMKFQWYEFFNDNRLKSLSSNIKMGLKDVKSKLLTSKSDLQYKFEKAGILILTSESKKGKKERWRLSIATKDINDKSLDISVKKDDLLMSLLSDHNEVLYIRHLRKISPAITPIKE